MLLLDRLRLRREFTRGVFSVIHSRAAMGFVWTWAFGLGY